jgi:hypothetical protein
MKNRVNAFVAAAVLACLVPAASFALVPYVQDFESLSASSPSALADNGWLVFGNVFSPGGGYLYGYGVFPAPNAGNAFCSIAVGEGGAEQGAQQLVVFSDYNNGDHANGNLIEANVFQEQLVGADQVGLTWTFEFQAKLGNLAGQTTAKAFIKTLDPNNGYAMTNFITADMTTIPQTWNSYSLSITIDASLQSQILQFGFMSLATNYEGSGVFYDNLNFHSGTVATESTTWSGVKALFE